MSCYPDYIIIFARLFASYLQPKLELLVSGRYSLEGVLPKLTVATKMPTVTSMTRMFPQKAIILDSLLPHVHSPGIRGNRVMFRGLSFVRLPSGRRYHTVCNVANYLTL